MSAARIACTISTILLLAAPAVADDAAKYKLMDSARLAIVDALDKNDAAAFAIYVDTTLRTEGVWFSTPACRKRFGTATVRPGKDLTAFVACFAPLGVKQSGLLVHYGPGISMSVKIDVTDGKAAVKKLSAFAGDPAAPEILLKVFEQNRLTGNPKITLDDAARAELAAASGHVAAFKVCVDKAGKVRSHTPIELAKGSALAKAIAAGVKDWTFTPFAIRGKPLPVCAVAFVRGSEQP